MVGRLRGAMMGRGIEEQGNRQKKVMNRWMVSSVKGEEVEGYRTLISRNSLRAGRLEQAGREIPIRVRGLGLQI